MDTTITSAPTEAGTTVTETPGQTPGIGDVDPNTGTVPGASEGGGSTETAEGGQQQEGQRRRWSLQDEVKELRAQRRDLREQLKSTDDVREELRQLREEMVRRSRPETDKTPTNFWQDPEGHLKSLRDEIAAQNEGLMTAFHQTREQEYAQQALRQEQATAVEFIRAQQGYSKEDDADLIEIIENIPNVQYLTPQFVAEFAWMKLRERNGIGDKTALKRQAAGVQGQPPGVGFGRKTWSQADFDAAVNMIEKNPHDPKNSELFNELVAAHKEGRVK